MGTEFKVAGIDEGKVITFADGEDYIHTQISLAAGQTDYRAVSATDKFLVFAVQFDPIIHGQTAADGSSIVWHTQLVGSKGSWWNLFVVENKADVPVSVIVKTKSI
ncbi:hypothetical protein [Duganella levis]|uniref:Uncharacterized protein n=1 Tax=Duganella levis TaxID=2692169 RepID=A0ABW9W8F6_9BURK|nr:hypothetical protein [Duganella levis]MYN30258.1 hypothetical protein [Duganella levis]